VIEEIVLNPGPDLDAVPVEVEQGIEERVVRETELGGNAAVFGNSNITKVAIRIPGGLNILSPRIIAMR